MYKPLLPALLLAAYGVLLGKVMVLKDMPMVKVGHIMLNFGGTDVGHGANFVPFATIVPYLLGSKGLVIGGINLVGNVVLLVPLGFLTPFVYRSMTWRGALALAAASGLAIETMQVLLRVGIFDIDDVLLNALGFMLGYGAYLLLQKFARTTLAKALVIAVFVGAVVAAALFFNISLGQAPNRLGETPGGTAQGSDLCGGTGGNGQITSVTNMALVLELKNGSNQTIRFTDETVINTPAGPGSVSDLKAGDRITLVGGPNPDGSFTAEAVFVCGVQDSEN